MAELPEWAKKVARENARRKKSRERLAKLKKGFPLADGRVVRASNKGLPDFRKKKKKDKAARPRPMIDPGRSIKDKAEQKKKLYEEGL